MSGFLHVSFIDDRVETAGRTQARPIWLRLVRLILVLLTGVVLLGFGTQGFAANIDFVAAASTFQDGFEAQGALNKDRFSAGERMAWKGRAGESNWWWQVEFVEPRTIGVLLQIQGDHEFVFRDCPKSYVWQSSADGRNWHELPETRTTNERRIFRILRLTKSIKTKFLRLCIGAAAGDFPTLREVEFFSDPRETIAFPDWIVVVNTTHEAKLPGHGQEFIPLAKSCQGWAHLQAQQVWLDAFNPEFLAIEPRPLCAFLSGNFKDWCEVNRELWRGTQKVLESRRLPMWASCGGAQGVAILAETGVDKPWDCPHCRDPQNPKLPIYTHIGHTAMKACGDYSGCVFERGSHRVEQVGHDPVFEGLAEQFAAMQSHCGQIEWPPKGWELIATAGEGTKTKVQCLRVKDAPIYAAQFHIEMDGTPETSRQIMGNFLRVAKTANP
jgi:hypothetical protein